MNITCTLLSDDLSIYDSRGLIAGSLSAGQSVWFELRVNRMGPYFESVMTSDEKVPLAQITVRHFDPIAREFESTAELVFDRSQPDHLAVQLLSKSVSQEKRRAN